MVTRSGREEIVIISQHLSVLTYRSSWLAYPTFRQKTELGCPSLGCSSLYNTAILDLSDFFFLTHVASWSPGSALLSVLTRLGSVLVLSTLDAHRCLCCALDLLDNKPSLPPKPRSSHVPL